MFGVRRCRTVSARVIGFSFLPLVAFLILAGMPTGAQAEPTCKLHPEGLTICYGPYALCDKATCQPIKGTQSVECTCPVLNGPSFASLPQLGGSCTAPQGKVYSLFSLQGFQPDKVLSCSTGSFAQCWNATCVLQQGGQNAVCTCPLCPGPFTTPGGDCNVANCTGQILVGAAFPVSGSGCPSK